MDPIPTFWTMICESRAQEMDNKLFRCFLGALNFETHWFRTGNANFFCKGLNSTFDFARHLVSGTAIHLFSCSKQQMTVDVFQYNASFLAHRL